MENKLKLKEGKIAIAKDWSIDLDQSELADFFNTMVRDKEFIGRDREKTAEELVESTMKKAAVMHEGDMIQKYAYVDGKLAAFGIAWRQDKKEKDNVELGVMVSKPFRRLGLAEALMQNVLAAARELKPKNIYLTVFADNEPAKKLYAKLGFKEIARLPDWYNHFGEYHDKLIMRLEE